MSITENHIRSGLPAWATDEEATEAAEALDASTMPESTRPENLWDENDVQEALDQVMADLPNVFTHLVDYYLIGWETDQDQDFIVRWEMKGDWGSAGSLYRSSPLLEQIRDSLTLTSQAGIKSYIAGTPEGLNPYCPRGGMDYSPLSQY